MDMDAKLALLSKDAQYDLSCACGTNNQDRRRRSNDGMWVYPVALPSGGRGIMLKTLLSNACTNDCKYCPLRNDRDLRRCSLAPDEIARVFMDYVRRRKIIGLFLTSGVVRNPDYTMDRITATAELLRGRYQYRGFIHLKVIPGACEAAIEKAVSLASSVSLNVETPTAATFGPLSSKKNFQQDIVRPIKLISKLTEKGSRYSRVKQTTQFIVGASTERDCEIVKATAGLYGNLNLNRVYFSAYQRGLGDPNLPAENSPKLSGPDLLTREHRLYQTDFLLRKYKWTFEDIPFDDEGNLRIDIDPKQYWANLHPEFFPVRLRSSSRADLLHAPGLGPVYVSRILAARRTGGLRSLKDIGMKGNRLIEASKYAVAD